MEGIKVKRGIIYFYEVFKYNSHTSYFKTCGVRKTENSFKNHVSGYCSKFLNDFVNMKFNLKNI